MKPAFFSLVLALVAVGSLSAIGQGAGDSSQPIPMIVMENVPLTDAIRNLARQDGMNLILDPVLSGSSVGTDGKYFKNPSVTARWKSLTARQALERLLSEHKLALVESPATTVTRITFADAGAKPVPASQVVGDTNKIVPLLVMDDVPLVDALNQLARNAGLKVELDSKVPGVSTNPGGRFTPPPTASFRWTQLSAAQALAALLDAYDLEMTKDTIGEKHRIAPKTKPETKVSSPEKAATQDKAK